MIHNPQHDVAFGEDAVQHVLLNDGDGADAMAGHHPHGVQDADRRSDSRRRNVREPEEFNGPLGHVPGARLMPLGALSEKVSSLEKAKPVVTVCRSGARSAQATVILAKAGFERVANLSGGMLRWRSQRFPVEGGTE